MIADLLNVVYPRVLLSQTWRLISLQANRRGAAKLAFRIINFGYAR